MIAVPTAADLHGLLKLCGSEDATIAYLARVYGMPVDDIAPTFRAWIANLPPLPPPSRQRSAPPNMSAAAGAAAAAAAFFSSTQRGTAAAATGVGGVQVMQVVPPPPSAPAACGGSGERSKELVFAMKALNSRLNVSSRGLAMDRPPLASTTNSLKQQQQQLMVKRRGGSSTTTNFLSSSLAPWPEEEGGEMVSSSSPSSGGGRRAAAGGEPHAMMMTTMNPLASLSNGPPQRVDVMTDDTRRMARKWHMSSGADEEALRAYLERSALTHGSKIRPTGAASQPTPPWWNNK